MDFNWFLVLLAVVFCPLWIPLAIVIIFYSFFIVCIAILGFFGFLRALVCGE
jgi:hypothetical protein